MKLFSLLVSLLFVSQVFSQSFEGVWKGEISVQGTKLPLVFELKKGDTWTGTMQSPKQSEMKMPIQKVSMVGDSVLLEMTNFQIRYAGKWQDGKIVGTFQQGGMKLELILSKGEIVSAPAPVRPQEPNAPYSYDTLDVKIPNKTDHMELAGTITQPKAIGKYPAVILVSGSGPQNRDEEIMGHKPFKVLADYLTKNGVVVLRYDDRGVGKSGGDFGKSTITDFKNDAAAALAFLKKQSNVDKGKIGLIGHSEGGLVGLLLAGDQHPDLNFVVSLAGPALPIDSLMVLQTYHVGKSAGMSEVQLAAVRPINRRNFEISKSQLSEEEAMTELIKNMRKISMANESSLKQQLAPLLTKSYRYFMRIDPTLSIQKIKIPLYAAFGELDIQVPYQENSQAIQTHLPQNAKSKVKSYPTLNHLFQPAKTGNVQEYSEIETTIDTQVLKDISDWIKSLQ